MTAPAFAATTPSFRIDGQARDTLARDLLHLEIEETTAGLRTLRATFTAVGPAPSSAAGGLLYLDGSLDFGKRLEVDIGPAGSQSRVFAGVISAVEGEFGAAQQPAVTILAEDRLMRLRMTRRSKTYLRKSDADIARAIAQEHGLSAQADADGPTYDVVQQCNQSDLAFLRERARLIQAEVSIADDTLYFQSRTARTGASVTLRMYSHLLWAKVRADLAHQRTKIIVSGYDATAREVIEEEAGNDAISAEISGGRTGPQILQDAFGERVGHRSRENPQTTEEAQAFARAEMLRRGRGFVKLRGLTAGTPSLVVGGRLTLQDIGAPFSGEGYYATRVIHTYDLAHGLRTAFEAERATLSEAT